jgi:hypothetical protein
LVAKGWRGAAEPLSILDRFGLGFLGYGPLTSYPLERVPFGWYSDWSFAESPARPGGVEYVQLIRVREGSYPPNWDAVARAARANPGSLWIIGNEPECIWQDNRTPEQYAEIYRQCYQFLKEVDPTSQIAIGGVVQPTPLRLQWLDRAMAHYQALYGAPMPVDVWNIHIQITLERRGDYGSEIPAGIDADRGADYPWWENANVDIFRQLIWDFRHWMAQRGQTDKPLIISEYGVLYPSQFFDTLGGMPGDERVKRFMRETFEFLLSARDEGLGYPGDDHRLVQRWLWFSLNYPLPGQTADPPFNGGLCDPFTRELTIFGEYYEQLLNEILQEHQAAVSTSTDPR